MIEEIINNKSQDEDELDQKIKGSIIKSFMMIFTNEKSQHLLLNVDLIDIAFNCMQNCNEISLVTQRNVSKLISLQLKFPEVQKKILGSDQMNTINGISNLIELLMDQDSQTNIKELLDSRKDILDKVITKDNKKKMKQISNISMKIEIIQYLIMSCLLLSKNIKFVKKETSHRVLNSMVKMLQCQSILQCLKKKDHLNILSCIRNIINNSIEAKKLFE